MEKNITKNLVYLANPRYGGWVTFTAHLSLCSGWNLYQVSKKLEKGTRDYGYGVRYQNIPVEALQGMGGVLITAIDSNHYYILPFLKSASIVIHDPTELKEELLRELPRFKVYTIRRTVQKLLKEKYNIDSTFFYHPFYQYPMLENKYKSGSVSISRIDFDKHTEIILEANKTLENPTEIYGNVNTMYEFHKLKGLDFRKYYKGSFKKDFRVVSEILSDKKFMVDMSVIKNDGGGSQYTFLEAIHNNCVLVLNSRWFENGSDVFEPNKNCLIAGNAQELSPILSSKESFDGLIREAKLILNNHIFNPDIFK